MCLFFDAVTANFNENSSHTPHATLYKGAMLVSADVITVLDTRVELPQLSTALSSNQRQIHAVSVGMANGRARAIFIFERRCDSKIWRR